MSLATPRVLPKHLEQFGPNSHAPVNTVRLLGTITSIHGSSATLTSGDGDTVTLILNRDSHIAPQSIYEVVGKVINLEGGHGLGMRVMAATEWPKNSKGMAPDLNLYEAVVDATHRHKEIFYGDDAKSEDTKY